MMITVVVSACLAGEKCRWNKTDATIPSVKALVEKGEALPVCPELLGGLPVPRDRAEILQERVISERGEDLTEQYEKGAKLVLQLCLEHGVSEAILTSRSPSCGSGRIYDGTFSETLISGNGITAALLRNHGITIVSSDEIGE